MIIDPISDMLARLRNAAHARHAVMAVPSSRMKVEIARILKEEGFIKNYKVVRDDRQGTLKVHLKYGPDGKTLFHGLRRVSRPGRRTYVPCRGLKSIYGGIGISILSTPKGILTEKKCREMNLGGEVLCEIW